MRYLSYLLALLLLLSVSPAVAATHVIRNDGGGSVVEFIRKFDQWKRNGDKIIIDGFCASSCTMALGNPRVCVTKRAELGFHYSFYEFPGTYIYSKSGTALMWSHFPRWVKDYIYSKGGWNPHSEWTRFGPVPKLWILYGNQVPKNYRC